jgi:hypothetical protein
MIDCETARKEVTTIFTLGDYLAGILVGAATALSVRMVVWPGMDMVIAMILGMNDLELARGVDTVVALNLGHDACGEINQPSPMYGGSTSAWTNSDLVILES